MAGRPGVVVTAKRPADGGTSPNEYAPYVSAHFRVNWPPRAGLWEVLATLDDAHREICARIREEYHAP